MFCNSYYFWWDLQRRIEFERRVAQRNQERTQTPVRPTEIVPEPQIQSEQPLESLDVTIRIDRRQARYSIPSPPERFQTIPATGSIKQLSSTYFKLLGAIISNPRDHDLHINVEDTTIPRLLPHVQPSAGENPLANTYPGQNLPLSQQLDSNNIILRHLKYPEGHDADEQLNKSMSEYLCQLCCVQNCDSVMMPCGHGGNSFQLLTKF